MGQESGRGSLGIVYSSLAIIGMAHGLDIARIVQLGLWIRGWESDTWLSQFCLFFLFSVMSASAGLGWQHGFSISVLVSAVMSGPCELVVTVLLPRICLSLCSLSV